MADIRQTINNKKTEEIIDSVLNEVWEWWINDKLPKNYGLGSEELKETREALYEIKEAVLELYGEKE